MQTVSSALAARKAKLFAAFVAQIPSQLAEARDLLIEVGLIASPEDTAARLKRIFHNLRGSGATFGLKALSAEAEAAEMVVDQAIRRRGLASAEFAAEVRQHIATIDRLAARALGELPQANAADSDEGLPEPDTPSLRQDSSERRTVYVCDDDQFQAAQIHSQLSCFGYDVHSFSTVDELRNAVIANRPDAVIMDVVFPEDENAGLTVIRELQRVVGPKLPTVFVSGRSDFQARLQAVRAGGMAFLTKPLRCLDIVEHLDILTSNAQPEPYHVLVIDDEPHVAALHGSILEHAGMVVQLVHVPAAAMDLLRDFRPELVLMDMYMPGCTGRELAQVIRQMPEYVGIPIVYLSSETDAGKQLSALAVGADGFLVKPIKAEELVSSVTARAERMRTLRARMVRDSLTGLFNHTATMQFLESAVANARRRDGAVCFAMIDVDHFKSINDKYGHEEGDAALRSAAAALRKVLRRGDILIRWGGEEFLTVMPHTDPSGAMIAIGRMRAGGFGIRPDGKPLTASIGVAERVVDSIGSWNELVEKADQRMYFAKQNGKDRAVGCGDILIAKTEA